MTEEYYKAYIYDYPCFGFRQPKDAKMMFAFVWLLIKTVMMLFCVGLPLMLYSCASSHLGFLWQLPLSSVVLFAILGIFMCANLYVASELQQLAYGERDNTVWLTITTTLLSFVSGIVLILDLCKNRSFYEEDIELLQH